MEELSSAQHISDVSVQEVVARLSEGLSSIDSEFNDYQLIFSV